MKKQSFSRRFIAGVVTVTMTSVALIGLTSSPAAAAGGEVINQLGGAVAIANCWKTGVGWSQVGISPSCDGVSYVNYNNNAKLAWRYLAAGTSSRSLNSTYWHDVDAFRVEQGCAVFVVAGAFGGTWFEAYSWAPVWYKLDDLSTYKIAAIQCD